MNMKLLLVILTVIGVIAVEQNIDQIVEKCHCGRSYDPTCGSNGYMFNSPCELKCYNNITNSNCSFEASDFMDCLRSRLHANTY